jgi:tetratricopeptide (TPR) repeat protein
MSSDVVQLPLGHRLLAWFETNRKQAVWGAFLVAVLVLIIWFVVWQKGEKEVNASEALSKVTATGLANPGSRPDAAAYLKIVSEYPKSSAGARALLLAGATYFVDGKYTEAKTQFDRFAREYNESPFIAQALLGIAACQDAQGKTNEAVTAYKDLVDRRPNESVVPQAKFALARLYEAQGKVEQAKTYYEDLNRSDAYGSIGSEAGMRLEELLAKNPQLLQKPTTSSNTPAFKVESP